MTRSERMSPNRELSSLYQAIQKVNKADLYEIALKDCIKEREWDRFLNEAYNNPYKFM